MTDTGDASSWRPVLGAVLMGGASRRFGSDKAGAEFDGASFAERARTALADACDAVVAVTSRGAARGWDTVVPDLRPGEGPLAGIEAALCHAQDLGYRSVFVLAIDLPHVDTDTVRAVMAAVGDTPDDGPWAVAPAREGDPEFEPLCALYGVPCAEHATWLLDQGERAARALFARVDGRRVVLPAEQARAVALNVNRPGDLEGTS